MKVEKIKYPMGMLIAEGALVYASTVSGKRPALLVGPELDGHDGQGDRTRQACCRRPLCRLRRRHVWRGQRPTDFGGAAALANPLRENAVEQRARIRAAYDAMIAEACKRDLFDGRRAAIGFCFGGGNVLELARDGADIAAAVAIHPDLITAAPAKKGAIKANFSSPMAPPTRSRRRSTATRSRRKWMPPAPSGRCCCSPVSCTPIPIKARTFPASPAGMSRQRGRLYAITHQFIADAFAGGL